MNNFNPTNVVPNETTSPYVSKKQHISRLNQERQNNQLTHHRLEQMQSFLFINDYIDTHHINNHNNTPQHSHHPHAHSPHLHTMDSTISSEISSQIDYRYIYVNAKLQFVCSTNNTHI